MTHKHEWKVSYTMKHKETFYTTYYCKECKTFKQENTKPPKARASNMGGEFSTNWRP